MSTKTECETGMRYADIIVDNKSKHIDNLFTYRVVDDSIKDPTFYLVIVSLRLPLAVTVSQTSLVSHDNDSFQE